MSSIKMGGEPDKASLVKLLGGMPEGSIQLQEMGDRPIVRGKQKAVLTVAQYNVVHAVLNSMPKGLTKDELTNKSNGNLGIVYLTHV